MKRKLRVLVVMNDRLVPAVDPRGESGVFEELPTEHAVVAALQSKGHDVYMLGIDSDLAELRESFTVSRPEVAVNLMGPYHGIAVCDREVAAYLERMAKPFTGCNASGLTVARDRGLAARLLVSHRVPVAAHQVFPQAAAIQPRESLEYPLVVRPVNDDASGGVPHRVVAQGPGALRRSVASVHRRFAVDAIAEQQPSGREMVVGVWGTRRLAVLPPWQPIDPEADAEASKRSGNRGGRDASRAPAIRMMEGLDVAALRLVSHTAKRAYKALHLSGYAQISVTLGEGNQVWVTRAQPNPDLSPRSGFVQAVQHAGLDYPALIQRLLRSALSDSSRAPAV